MDENAPLETLLSMLRLIDESDIPDIKDDEEPVYLNNRLKTYEQYTELINKVTELADQVLMNDHGHCDWDSIHIVKQHGYDVFAGEQDRWGWISGCILTKKGILVYG